MEQSPGDLLNTTLRCKLQRDSLKENRQTNSTKVTVFRAFVFLQGSKEEKHLEAWSTHAVQQQTQEQKKRLQVLNLASLSWISLLLHKVESVVELSPSAPHVTWKGSVWHHFVRDEELWLQKRIRGCNKNCGQTSHLWVWRGILWKWKGDNEHPFLLSPSRWYLCCCCSSLCLKRDLGLTLQQPAGFVFLFSSISLLC